MDWKVQFIAQNCVRAAQWTTMKFLLESVKIIHWLYNNNLNGKQTKNNKTMKL